MLYGTVRRSALRGTRFVFPARCMRQWKCLSTKIPEKSVPESENTKDVPWYLRPEESSMAPELHRPLPELPESSPPSLGGIIELMTNKLGIEDIKIFDKREDEYENDGQDIYKHFIVIGSGKSDKHLQKATVELRNYIKHDLGSGSVPTVEGFANASSLLKKERKAKRKLKKNTGYHFEDYGVPLNSWIMVNCDHDVDKISVHFLTEERRQELNLEQVWCKPEDRHLYKRAKKPLISDDIFSGLRRYHGASNTPVYETVGQFLAGSKRYYSSISTAEQFSKAEEFITHLDNLSISEAQALVKDTDFVSRFDESLPDHPTKESFDAKFQLYKKLHQLDPSRFGFELLEDIFYTKLSVSYLDHGIDDLIELVVAILESPLDIKPIAKMIQFKIEKINAALSVVEIDETFLQNWETKLTPYLLSVFSEFKDPRFVKPKQILDNVEDITRLDSPKIFFYSSQIDVLYEILKYKNFDFLKSNESQLVLLMFLAVYGNGRNYEKFYGVLSEVYSNSSQIEDHRPWDFVISFIYKTAALSEFSHFLNSVYPEISTYNEFSPLFKNYVTAMQKAIEADGGGSNLY